MHPLRSLSCVRYAVGLAVAVSRVEVRAMHMHLRPDSGRERALHVAVQDRDLAAAIFEANDCVPMRRVVSIVTTADDCTSHSFLSLRDE
jgi:hypothetical protein